MHPPVSAIQLEAMVVYIAPTSSLKSLLSNANPLTMTVVSNDPSGWPDNDTHQVASYVLVASSTAILYDWALTFGQEVELFWVSRISSHTNSRTRQLIRGRGHAGLA
ncbi:hypothetical protein BDR05DRAFT_551044 [Suillus weaverae]|nr:hypothetical protein BDR05DRAFT_551044 [Suillus weaverae]